MAKILKVMVVALMAVLALGTTGCSGVSMESDSELTSLNGKQGWSVSGTLVTGQGTVPVSMQTELDPDNYTVQIQTTQPGGIPVGPGLNVGGGAQTEAVVTWSVAGTPVTRRITAPGSITGVGEGVRVQIFDVTNTTAYLFNAGQKYPVSASVSRGTRGTTMTPPVLIPGPNNPTVANSIDRGPGMYAIPNNDILTIPIPQGVGVISVMVNCVDLGNGVSVTNGNVQVSMGNSGFGVEVGAAPVNLGTWMPVPPGATILGMRNISGTTMFFSVAFGIDG